MRLFNNWYVLLWSPFDNILISKFKFIAFKETFRPGQSFFDIFVMFEFKIYMLYDVQSKHTSFYNCFVWLWSLDWQWFDRIEFRSFMKKIISRGVLDFTAEIPHSAAELYKKIPRKLDFFAAEFQNACKVKMYCVGPIIQCFSSPK